MKALLTLTTCGGFIAGYFMNCSQLSIDVSTETAVVFTNQREQTPSQFKQLVTSDNEFRQTLALSKHCAKASTDRLEHLIEIHKSDETDLAVTVIAQHWAARDGEGLLQYISTLGQVDYSLRYHLQDTLYRFWAKTDPERGLEAALSNPRPDGVFNGLGTLIEALGDVNPELHVAYGEDYGHLMNGFSATDWISKKILRKP